jgi:HKD family nuclease
MRGTSESVIVPSEEYPHGLSMLESVVAPGAGVRAAVAFVTVSGVAELARLLADVDDLTLEITARAGDATEPEALLELRDALGVDVMVVIGRFAQAFHPKLWLIEREDELVVMSGSGNLTTAGLTTNDEQFELLRLARGSDEAAAQVERFERLTRNALPLDHVEGSTIWEEWLTVRRRQAQLRREIAHVERHLNEREPMPDRSADKARLIEDLQRLYDAAVAADLPRADGARYYPTRLLVAINRARDGERDPVKIVTDTIRRRTDGLDILLRAGLVDLTLESLVLDKSKPYHDIFGARSIQLARARLAEFEREGIPLDDDREPDRASVMTVAEIAAWFERRLAEHPDGYDLPLVHQAQATLLGVESDRAVVRRESGSLASPPLRLLAFRLREMAIGRSFRQSELSEDGWRDSAVIGPLLADLPSVAVADGVFHIDRP